MMVAELDSAAGDYEESVCPWCSHAGHVNDVCGEDMGEFPDCACSIKAEMDKEYGDPALATLQTVLDDLYPAFVAWVDDGAPEPPGTALMAALAAQGYVLAPAERVLVGAGQVEEG